MSRIVYKGFFLGHQQLWTVRSSNARELTAREFVPDPRGTCNLNVPTACHPIEHVQNCLNEDPTPSWRQMKLGFIRLIRFVKQPQLISNEIKMMPQATLWKKESSFSLCCGLGDVGTRDKGMRRKQFSPTTMELEHQPVQYDTCCLQESSASFHWCC